MLAEPAATPVTIPVAGTTVATPEALLLQVPSIEVLVMVDAVPEHIEDEPLMAAGVMRTLIALNAEQPVFV